MELSHPVSLPPDTFFFPGEVLIFLFFAQDCLLVLFWLIFFTKGVFSVCLATHAFHQLSTGLPDKQGKHNASRGSLRFELVLHGCSFCLNPIKPFKALPEYGLQRSTWRNSAFFFQKAWSSTNFLLLILFFFSDYFFSTVSLCISPPIWFTSPELLLPLHHMPSSSSATHSQLETNSLP